MTLHTGAPTETASQAFGEQVLQIPGVLRVQRTDDDLIERSSFRVTIRKGDRAARYAVYRLEAEMYARYEGTNLDIRVVEGANGDPVGADSRTAI